MGQVLSDESPRHLSHEELTHELAVRFAEKCLTSLEVHHLKDVFKNLADTQGDIRYLKEDTIARFLEIPDILHVSPVIFQMVSYIGAFPFLQGAPAVLGLEQLIMVVVIMTARFKRVLARGPADRAKLLFKSLAVYDRKASNAAIEVEKEEAGAAKNADAKPTRATGFAVDEPADEDEDEDDDLEIAAFELLDIHDAVRQGDAPKVQDAMIPADNFRKLLMLLILIAPMSAQERLSMYSTRVVGDELESLRSTAENILAAFLNVEKAPGIKFSHFNRVMPVCFPYLFTGFNPLFEHFLFSKELDLAKHKGGDPVAEKHPEEVVQPLLQDSSDILNLNVLSQLSFFLPGSDLFRRLRLLYSGNEAGFSMGSFETKVFNWRAPTILLVRGSRISDEPQGGQEAAFASSIPPRRFPNGSKGDRLTFGVYLSQAWKHTSKECFGESDTVLFQLEPVHDVFPASKYNSDYISFTKPPTNRPMLGVGCPHPRASQTHRRNSIMSLGSVSLLLDDSFEYGVFTHDWTAAGGAFHTSQSRKFDFQDRFEIESLEVWGCGGDEEAKSQAERWAWEAREAEARRKINLGTGDIAADRALLEMAGLVGHGQSGGSMG
ncbi:Restriction of telomere capping protein 5 [Colletotrichum orbiculare MAFF 240422]|uniref:Restriction of telomere capping protein 5 n=1 Tax=Colletotrichum orbiculare (strain 104-T / ATCC 96160 / CBS 514.97 / LARS 414 / MAFF 240422) TaxID=1213857 RepID=N4VUT8_COLOR|nr:Restriction of telomere capping protein 5 [Colletotrichum orbiculare MAFF 240422]